MNENWRQITNAINEAAESVYGYETREQSENVKIRTEMLKERAKLKRENEDGVIPDDVVQKLKEATKACKKENRRQAKERRKEIEDEIRNSNEKQRFDEVWRGARNLAGTGVGPNKRNFYNVDEAGPE